MFKVMVKKVAVPDASHTGKRTRRWALKEKSTSSKQQRCHTSKAWYWTLFSAIMADNAIIIELQHDRNNTETLANQSINQSITRSINHAHADGLQPAGAHSPTLLESIKQSMLHSSSSIGRFLTLTLQRKRGWSQIFARSSLLCVFLLCLSNMIDHVVQSAPQSFSGLWWFFSAVFFSTFRNSLQPFQLHILLDQIRSSRFRL